MGLLISMINNHNRKQQKLQERPMRNQLHPSTIGMCQRRIVFDMIIVPKTEPDDRLLRVFENGHSMHDRYQKLFADIGILEEEERALKRGDIGGHTDAVIKVFSLDEPSGEEMLVELKSAAENSYKWMAKNNRPKNEHRDQLQFYMHLSGIRKGILLVENKDTQELWEYPMSYDPEQAESLEKKAYWCIDMAKKRKLPPIPKYHTPSYYKCSICDYNFYCHAGSKKQDGTVRFPIPFKFGTQAYFDALDIIDATANNLEIPDVLEANTNGALFREVEQRNRIENPTTPQEMVEQYITNN